MAEKLVLEVNDQELVFVENADGDMEFDIPQKALKLLCNFLYLDENNFIVSMANNQKEFYPSGNLKTLTLSDPNLFKDENYGYIKYEFDEDHKLISCETSSLGESTTIKINEYYKKDNSKFVKGILTNCRNDLEEFESYCNMNKDFYIDVDTEELKENEFSIFYDGYNIYYDAYGLFKSCEGPEGETTEVDENGDLSSLLIYDENINAKVFFTTIGDKKDGWLTIQMYYRNFYDAFWDVIDIDVTEDDNGDISETEDDYVNKNQLQILGTKLFAFVSGYQEDEDYEDYDVDNYEIVYDDHAEEDVEKYDEELKYIKLIDVRIKGALLENFAKDLIYEYDEPDFFNSIVMF